MSGLQTDYLALAREGMTLDGREITRQQIVEMADLYDPDIYNALINDNHDEGRYAANFGKVLPSLMAKEDSHGKMRLYGRLEPTLAFAISNARGGSRHFSIEMHPNFQNNGKAYLVGLAATNEPSSTGTSEVKLFSRMNDTIHSHPEELTLFDDPNVVELFSTDKKKPGGFFSKHFSKSPENEGEAEMTKEEREGMIADMGTAFASALKPLEDGMKDLGEQFSKFGEGEEPETTPEGGDAGETVSAEEYATLKAENEEFKKKFNKAEKFTQDDDDFSGDDDLQGVI